MDVVLRADDIPQNGLYNRNFHILDICKDATEATPPILKDTKGLYGAAMRALFNAPDDVIRCRSYKDKLLEIEGAASTEGGIVKQINRLTSPLGLVDTGIPQSIRKCIRDSGPVARSFNPDISILYNPSDYTDPSSRTEVPVSAEKFPNGGTFYIGEDVFNRIIGERSPIRNFSATMNADNTCHVRFSVFLEIEHVFETIISSNFHDGTGSGSEFFTVTDVPPGNPKKNNFFINNNPRYKALIGSKSIGDYTERQGLLARAIGYIVSKEYFGDILIAMVALKYKQIPANDAAIFTSDNALTAICKMWKLNVVSKNWNRSSSTEESVAILYNADPAEELRRNKEQIKLSVIAWNSAIRERLQYVVNTVTQIKHLGDITDGQKKFIRSIIEYIEKINAFVATIVNDDDLPSFRKEVVKYQIKNMIHSIEGETVTFVRGIKHMFRTVPLDLGKIDIPGEFVETLQTKRGNARQPFRVYRTTLRARGGQRGGTLENDTDLDPTGVLKLIIARNISLEIREIRTNNYVDITPDEDDEKEAIDNIYNYLYFLYNLECKICFDEGIIRTLIYGYIGDIQELEYEELIDEYNDLLIIEEIETNAESYEPVEPVEPLGSKRKFPIIYNTRKNPRYINANNIAIASGGSWKKSRKTRRFGKSRKSGRFGKSRKSGRFGKSRKV